MGEKHGNLSINSDNIFPIIKKWLYSDHDIFVRELVSNGCDAITKLKKLEMMGEYTFPDDYKNKIDVIVNPSHLSNLFKKETGTNFSSYLTDVRMQAAGKLLKSPDMLIYEVAEKTGYSNGGYFGKAFKKYWGVSPEEYKKEKR